MRPQADIEITFDRDVAASRRVRRAIALILADGDPIAADVQLAVSELITNVVIHTAAGGTFRMWDPAPAVPLRIEVDDTSVKLPRICDPLPAEGGRGLRLLTEISDGWGVVTTAAGKTVWAVFDRSCR